MNASLQLEEFLPYRISRLSERISGSLADVYSRRFQLSIAQWRVLATLQEMPGIGAKAIAARTNLDKVKVSRAVSGLEQRGYLLRRPAAHDGRAFELRLTTSGEALFHVIEPLALEWEGQLLSALGSKQKQSLYELLQQLEEGLAALDPASQNVSGD